MNVDHSISKAFMLIKPNNLDDFMDNDADDVLDDVCEDEWLQDALRKVSRLSQSVGQLMTYPPLRLEGLLFELERNLLPNIPRNLRIVSSGVKPPLRWERQKQICNEDLCIELEYFSEEYDEEREMEPRLCGKDPIVHWIIHYPLPDGLKCLLMWVPMMERETPTTTCTSSKNSQKAGSIINYEDLKAKFQLHFSQQKKIIKMHLAVHNIKQKERERTRAFFTRTRILVDFLSTDLPTTYKGLMEKTYTRIEAREVATNRTLNDHREGFDRFKKNSSWDNSRGKRNRGKISPYRGA
ncbi:hypothetical protein Tco_1274623 [Tanacetum coccineum]